MQGLGQGKHKIVHFNDMDMGDWSVRDLKMSLLLLLWVVVLCECIFGIVNCKVLGEGLQDTPGRKHFYFFLFFKSHRMIDKSSFKRFAS